MENTEKTDNMPIENNEQENGLNINQDNNSEIEALESNQNTNLKKSFSKEHAELLNEEELIDTLEEEHDLEYYTSLSREELLALIEEKVKEDDIDRIKKSVGLIRAAFKSKNNLHKQEIHDEHIQSGNNEEEIPQGEIEIDEIEAKFNHAFEQYKKKKAHYIEEAEKEKIENLKAKDQIIEELRKLVESEEELKTTYDAFRDLQEKWKEIGAVPQKERNNLWQNYHFLIEKFFDKVKINKELKDLDLKKNLEKKIEICEKTEKLILETSIKKSFALLQKYHDEWREVGPIAGEKKDEIWERFSAATRQIHERRRDFYNEQREKQQQNYILKNELCEKAESIIKEEINAPNIWQEKTIELQNLQNQWRSIGFAPRNVNDEVWNRFRTALNTFFKKKREFFKDLKDDQKENYDKKIEICLQAEALQDSEDWKNTTNELIRLQKEWKTIGPVPKKHSDKIWKRFRAACDHYFQRKEQFFSNIDQIEQENLEKRKQLIQELSNYQFDDNNDENLTIINEYQRKWHEIGRVPIKEKDSIQHEFRNVINSLMERLKLSNTEKASLSFKNKIDKMKEGSNSNFMLRKERSFLINKLSKLQTDIQLWENNIGFFANSKNADVLKKEILQKIENAKKEVIVLQEKIKMLNNA